MLIVDKQMNGVIFVGLFMCSTTYSKAFKAVSQLVSVYGGITMINWVRQKLYQHGSNNCELETIWTRNTTIKAYVKIEKEYKQR
mgnify:FL=1